MAATYESLINEIRGALRGYGLVREQATFLNGAVTNSALSLTVDDGSLVQVGHVEIDSEVLDVQSIASNVLTIAPDGRGFDGTTAVTHADNARVRVAPAYPVWRIARALNDAITGTWPALWVRGSTSFTFNATQTAYELPVACEEILSVTATTRGLSREQVEIHDYRFDTSGSLTEFASGKYVTLRAFPELGQTVTVNYQKAPSEISAGQAFTASGLSETARSCVVYGALARLLSFIDPTRVTADSAVAEGWGTVQRAGTATQMAAQLTARYQMELNAEQARQRKAYPQRVRRVGR